MTADPAALARALRDDGTPEAEAALLDALREPRGRLTYYRLPPGSDAPRTRSEARACADWLGHVRARGGRPRGAKDSAPRAKRGGGLVVLPCRVSPEARAAVEALPREERSRRVSEAIVRGLG